MLPKEQVSDSSALEFEPTVDDRMEKQIDRLVYQLYDLTQKERDAIGYIDFHKDNEGEADDDDE